MPRKKRKTETLIRLPQSTKEKLTALSELYGKSLSEQVEHLIEKDVNDLLGSKKSVKDLGFDRVKFNLFKQEVTDINVSHQQTDSGFKQ